MNFKKITKRGWWLLIAAVLTPSFYVLANFILQDFYISGPGQESQLIAREGWGNVDRVIVNNSSNSYFVPNKTSAEWVAFRSNLPSNVSVAAPCTASTPCGDNCYIVDGTDVDIMGTVLIGNQCWMTDNLKISSGLSIWNYFSSGSSFTNRYACRGTNNNCVANDEELFYQKEALMPFSQYLDLASTEQGVQGLCPTGWRIPSRHDIDELKTNTNCGISDYTLGHNCLNSFGFDNSLYGYRLVSGTTSNSASSNCGYYILSNAGLVGANWITEMMYVPNPSYSSCNISGNPHYASTGASVRCMKGGTTGIIDDKKDDGGGVISN